MEVNIYSFITVLFVIELLVELMIVLLSSILALVIIGILIFRLYLDHQAKKLSEDIDMSTDIPTETDKAYQGKFINESDKREILSPYEEDYQRASKLSAWLDRFHVDSSAVFEHGSPAYLLLVQFTFMGEELCNSTF